MAKKSKKSSKTTTIIEEKEEIMVDHTSSSSKITQNPTKTSAYFLKPTINANALPTNLPEIQSFSSLSKLNVILQFNSTPLKGWKTWVNNLEKTHEPAWRKTGIFDAIKCSTYHIAKDTDLLISLVEKWCPETNTFVFPWGEVTVTLEDVFILGGFSPLGVSVNSSSLGKDVERVENKLIESYRKLIKTNNNLSHFRWQEHFMGCGGQIEYAGFLALWLVRHVFPTKNISLVTQSVFAIAARISCGAKFALGPAVLACLYRDLTVMKREIVDSLGGGALIVKLSSPFQLVQVWAWERFPSLGRVPRMIYSGEMRLVRWEYHGKKVHDRFGEIKICLDSARTTFRWRPYGVSIENWSLPRFYVDSGTWVVVNSDEDWKLIARCLMVGQLEGLDFVEGYNPHRVSLQFGFDQDIPKSFDGSKAKATCSEVGYSKNSKGLKLYLPPRLHEGDVTYRYFDWWKTMVNVDEGALVGSKRKKKTSKKTEPNRSVDQEEGNTKLSEMLLAKKQNCDAMNSLCLQVAAENQNLGSEVEQLKVTNNHSVGEGSNNSDRSNFNKEKKENEMNISCSKLAKVEPNRSLDQEEGNMKRSEMLLKMTQGCDAMNSPYPQVAIKHEILGNEISPEEGLRMSEDIARERNIIKHDVKMEKSLECLAANVPKIEPTESEGTLIKVACEDEPARALCQGPKQDTNHGNIIPFNSQVIVIDDDDDYDHNKFPALCLEYESRVSSLEKQVFAVTASNRRRLASNRRRRAITG